jgi:DUF2075 family protein
MPDFLTKALLAGFTTGIAAAIYGFIGYPILTAIFGENLAILIIIGAVGLTFLWVYYEQIKDEFNGKISSFTNAIATANNEVELIKKSTSKEIENAAKETEKIKGAAIEAIGRAKAETEIYKTSLIEKSTGFPTLLSVIAEFDAAKDEAVEDYLRYKKHPSIKSSEIVKEHNQKRRFAEFERKKTQLLIEYYESLAPFLIDYKNEIALPEEEDVLAEYTEEERADATTQYLTKDEFKQLPTTEKNQRALERYWKRTKSKWLIGRIYERYVGHLYEQQGYDVEYVGIFKGYEDLGRDLICRKGKEIIVIQCKNWSKFKTIFEKHIFQFFGTVFQYRDENKDKNIRAIFYTTTTLSDLAKRFAKELNIELQESFKMDNGYPCIKCNISQIDGTKIYHLPFDQQYDKVRIEPHKGEFYCATVKEAEDAGFRRAFRHKYNKGS